MLPWSTFSAVVHQLIDLHTIAYTFLGMRSSQINALDVQLRSSSGHEITNMTKLVFFSVLTLACNTNRLREMDLYCYDFEYQLVAFLPYF